MVMDKLHRHATLDDVLKRLLEDGIAADQCGRQSDDAQVRKRLPQTEPDGGGGQRDKDHAKDLDDLNAMLVFSGIIMLVVMARSAKMPL